MILAGDVGGTKTVLGLYRVGTEKLELVRTETVPSTEFSGLDVIVRNFLGDQVSQVKAACFGMPGPVVDGRVQLTNLPWGADQRELAEKTGIPRVELVNDLFATATGLGELGPDQFLTLQEGKPHKQQGNIALLAPGTGLGMSILFPSPEGPKPSPSEGGHIDFAPRNEDEIALLRSLQKKFDRVSVERLLCGPGLANIYEHLRDTGYAPEVPAVRERMAAGEDPGSVIGKFGLSGECALSQRTLDLFCSILGGTAGNIALVALASGGVLLGGGIPPKILPKLKEGGFLEGFLAKGRFRGLLETYPVRIVLNDRTALLGAARRAVLLEAAF